MLHSRRTKATDGQLATAVRRAAWWMDADADVMQ